MPLRISVRGTASITRAAERAVLSIKVSAQGPSQQENFAGAVAAAKKLQDIFTSQSHSDGTQAEQDAAAIERWTMSSITTHSWYDHNNKGEVSEEITHRTNLDFEVHVRDFDALGELAATLGDMEHVKIERVQWVLTKATIAAHKSELRKIAATDALQHAKDYAETFSMAVVKPFELVEDGVGGGGGDQFFGRSQLRELAAYAPHGGGSEQDVTHVVFRPEEIDMATSVTCKFLVGDSEEDLSEKA